MRKMIVCIILIILPTTFYAQSSVQKGTYTFNGSISISSQSFDNEYDSKTIVSFNPQYGCFLLDNLYTALSFKLEYDSFDYLSVIQIGLGPSLRYYFMDNNLNPYIGVSYIKLLHIPGKNDDLSSELRLTSGINYFVTNNFALETSVNYSFLNNSRSYKNLVKLSLSNIFQIGIGINYFIY